MTTPASSPWTPERIDALKVMWTEGKSAGLIANSLTDRDHYISRCAVIGKIHRLGLQRKEGSRTTLRPTPRRRQARAKPSTPRLWDRPEGDDLKEWRAIEAEMPVRIHRPTPRIEGAPAHSGSDPVPIDRLRDGTIHQCRFIDGEPTHDALYCGAAVVSGSSYCAHHHALVWAQRIRKAA